MFQLLSSLCQWILPTIILCSIYLKHQLFSSLISNIPQLMNGRGGVVMFPSIFKSMWVYYDINESFVFLFFLSFFCHLVKMRNQNNLHCIFLQIVVASHFYSHSNITLICTFAQSLCRLKKEASTVRAVTIN